MAIGDHQLSGLRLDLVEPLGQLLEGDEHVRRQARGLVLPLLPDVEQVDPLARLEPPLQLVGPDFEIHLSLQRSAGGPISVVDSTTRIKVEVVARSTSPSERPMPAKIRPTSPR